MAHGNLNTVELQISGFIGIARLPDMRKIGIIGVFFVNKLH